MVAEQQDETQVVEGAIWAAKVKQCLEWLPKDGSVGLGNAKKRNNNNKLVLCCTHPTVQHAWQTTLHAVIVAEGAK